MGDKEPRFRYRASIVDPDNLYYGTRGDDRAPKVLVVGESWGVEEQTLRLPFMGKSGQLLETLLEEADIPLHKCLFTNVVLERPRGNDMTSFFSRKDKQLEDNAHSRGGLYPHANVIAGLVRLRALIEKHQKTLELIIGLGNYTLWALTENSYDIGRSNDNGKLIPIGIGRWRGSQLYDRWCGIPFMPTYHPAATFKTYPWRGMLRHDLKMRARIALDHGKEGWREPDYDFQIRLSFAATCVELHRLIANAGYYHPAPYKIAVDLETRAGQIACIGIATGNHRCICIPLLCTDRVQGYFHSADEELEVLRLIKQLFTHPNVRIIGQNFLYDAQYIAAQMFFIPHIAEDTMIKHHCLFPGGGNPEAGSKGVGPQGLVQKALYHISSLYNDYHCYWKDEGKNWNVKMPEEQLWVYNCRDAVATYEASYHLDRVLKQEGQVENYEFQMRQVNELALPMMLQGTKIDLRERKAATLSLMDSIAEFEQKLKKMVPNEILPITKKGAAPWYRSPKQLAHILYDELGLPPVWGATGNPTTGKNALEILSKREPIVRPMLEAIGKLRSLGVFYGNFTQATLDPDNRMRCSFNPAGTETFRWSSSSNAFDRGTNLQNIPDGEKQSTLGVEFPNIKKFFIPDPGYIIVDADLAGADAQVVAWEAGDTRLKKLLRSGVKVHGVTAKELYGSDAFPHYDMCKRRIHATNYGGGPETLTETLLGMYGGEYTSLQIEKDFQAFWFNRYPGIKEWHERVQASIDQDHGVHNQFGNRIIFVNRLDRVFNEALAWVPQSTIALLCVRGMMKLQEAFPFVEMLLQVHDSLVFQLPMQHRGKLREMKAVLDEVEIPYPDDPLRIPWGFKVSDKSWGDVRDFE